MPGSYNKYKVVYWPFLLVLAGALVGYSFLHWWLVIRPQHSSPSETLTHWLLPAILSVGLYAIFLHQRFQLLTMERKPKPGRFIRYTIKRKYGAKDFSFILVPALAAPLIAAQYFLVNLSTRLQASAIDIDPSGEQYTFHCTWAITLLSGVGILWLVAASQYDKEAWQRFLAARDHQKRFRR